MSNVKSIRAALILAQAFAKHGVLFVPMPVSTPAEREEMVAKAWAKLDELEAAQEDGQQAPSKSPESTESERSEGGLQ
jgi:hypothetical protein